MKKKLALFLALTILILGGCRNPKPAVIDIMDPSDTSDVHQTETVIPNRSEDIIPESHKNENESDRNSDDYVDHNQTHPTEQISTNNQMPQETNPPELKPQETQPPVPRPSETRPQETKPIETKPQETEPTATVPPEIPPEQSEPPETKPPVTEPPATEPPEAKPESESIDTGALESYGRSYASSTYGYNGTSACTPGTGAGYFPAATKVITSMEDGRSYVRQAIDSQYKRDMAYGYLPYEEVDGKIVRCPINVKVESAGDNSYTITVYYGGTA